MSRQDRATFLNREQTEVLAQQVADFLEDRTFAKNPHIGLIGPGTRVAEQDPIELMTEAVEERTEQWLSPYVTGFRVSLRRSGAENERRAKACFSFSVRVLPPNRLIGGAVQEVPERDQFRSVDLCIIVENERATTVSLVIYDGDRNEALYQNERQFELPSEGTSISFPGTDFSEAEQHLMTLDEVGYPREGQRAAQARYRFAYGFSLSASLTSTGDDLYEFSCRLFDDDGRFIGQDGVQVDIATKQNLSLRREGLVDTRNESWAVGQLLELRSTLGVTGYSPEIRATPHGISGLHPINCAYDLSTQDEGILRFRDYAIVPERGRSIQQSNQTIADFMSAVTNRFGGALGLNSAGISLLSEAETAALGALVSDSDRLYTFQEDCVIKVLEAVLESRDPATAVPVSVQTAGGKTIGFLVPITMYAFATKLATGGEGTKALLFYPTKALINDQSDTILKLVWHLNRRIRQAGRTNLVSFGILHGDTAQKTEVAKRMLSTSNPINELLRLKCPLCRSQLTVRYSKIGERGIAERVTCSGSRDSSCELAVDEEAISLLNGFMRVTRESVYAYPPDILVTTPDMINFRLFFNPSEQSILGRSVKRCTACGNTTANLSQRAACERCGSAFEGPVSFTVPQILVFDEAHQLRGSFGSQVSFVVSRLEEAIRSVSGREYHPVFVFSSATLSRPDRFIQDFFGRQIPTKPLVRAEYDESAQLVRRIHLFVVPKGYSPEATLVQAVRSVFRNFPLSRLPNVLIFVNSLAESNELIHLLRHHRRSLIEERSDALPLPVIDGHSTDYGNEQRRRVEDEFTNGEVSILVATRTLEVGVDFEKIDVLIVYGAPFYLSDYIQRIGRAGRGHGALVINILPDKPVDFFFFGNYPLITEVEVRDQALVAEAVRISRSNETIRRRSAVRALLDYLATRQQSPYYYKDSPHALRDLLSALFVPQKASLGVEALASPTSDADLNPALTAYIERALNVTLSHEETKRVRKAIDNLLQSLVQRGVTNLSTIMSGRQGFLDRINAGDLRQSDYTVTIDHPDLSQLGERETSRERSLSIAISDYGPGQITSYRSLYFVIDHLESDPAKSETVRSELYRRAEGGWREEI